MSYILDALRRSQAERERGRVPGLDAQPLPADAVGGRRRGPPMVWVGGGAAALLLLVALLLAARWPRPPQQAVATAPAVGALPSPAAEPPRPLPPPTTALPPAPPSTPTPAPPPLPQVVSVPPAPPPPRSVTAQPPSSAETTPPPAATLPPSPAAPAPREAPRVLSLAQLTAEQRRELPPMAIGGSIWSDSPANRFVVVNGQVVREGEAAAPGVTLERIAPKAVTLRWRDLRIELPL